MNWTGSWVQPNAAVVTWKKRKISCLCHESNHDTSNRRLQPSHYTDWSVSSSAISRLVIVTECVQLGCRRSRKYTRCSAGCSFKAANISVCRILACDVCCSESRSLWGHSIKATHTYTSACSFQTDGLHILRSTSLKFPLCENCLSPTTAARSPTNTWTRFTTIYTSLFIYFSFT